VFLQRLVEDPTLCSNFARKNDFSKYLSPVTSAMINDKESLTS